MIDEVQRVPQLLDEVHWMIENTNTAFALCGSSARKLRRRAVNLLGGRAVTHRLSGLVGVELGHEFDIDRLLTHGTLPRIYAAERPRRLLESYVSTYLREEVAAEALVRNVPTFATFLDVAAMSDAEVVNYTNIARETGVSSTTIKSYFEILTDTLVAHLLPAYTARPKRRVVAAPKFYFADVGMANVLARRGTVERGGELYGKAFENWVHHELRSWIDYSESFDTLAYWRLSSGAEVDFIVGDGRLAVEAKASSRIGNQHLRGLREIARDHPDVRARVIVCLEPRAYRTDDDILVVPPAEFCQRLYAGEWT